MGAKVVVIEKRDSFSRNNVLHLWPFTIHDLRGLGAKKFYGKFCAGALDHISKSLIPEYHRQIRWISPDVTRRKSKSLSKNVVSVFSAESTVSASLSRRYSATAADPAEGRLDRCCGVSHQCWICQAAGTSGRSGKRRCRPRVLRTSLSN